MMTVTHNPGARQIIINTDQGFIVIDECDNPNITRVVISADNNGLTTNHEGGLKSPVMLCLWNSVAVKLLTGDEDTEPIIVGIYNDLEVGD